MLRKLAEHVVAVHSSSVQTHTCVCHGESRIDARLRESEGAQALLLEIIRRAAQDWVLYRDSSRAEHKQLAEEAYTWLFVEDESHPNWVLRVVCGTELTSFLGICNALDLNPHRVRKHVQNLTIEKMKALGRRPTTVVSRPVVEEQVHEVSVAFDYDTLILSMLPYIPSE